MCGFGVWPTTGCALGQALLFVMFGFGSGHFVRRLLAEPTARVTVWVSDHHSE